MTFKTCIEEVKHPISNVIMAMCHSKTQVKELYITNESSFRHAKYCLSKLVDNEYVSVIRRPKNKKFKLRILAKAISELKNTEFN